MTPQRDGIEASASMEPRGFSGLAALASSIDIETLKAGSVLPKKSPATDGRRSRSSLVGKQQSRQSQDSQTTPPLRDRSGGKRVLGIGAVVALVLFVANQSSTSSSSSYESSAPIDTGFAMTDGAADQPVEAATSTADDVASESGAPPVETGTGSLGDRIRRAQAGQGNNGLTQDESNPLDKYLEGNPAGEADVADADIYESKPIAGRNNVFGSSEIRYCLSEEIRLKGAEKVIDEREASQIDRFNQLVDDYNYRCSEYRYRAGTRQRVLSQVEVRRARLEAEGAARFR